MFWKRVIVFILLAFASFAASPGWAQIEMVLTPQPESLFRLVFGADVEGYDLWEANVCNNSPEPVTFHSGRLSVAAQKNNVPVIATVLVPSVVRNAESRNWLALGARTAEGVGWIATIASATKAIRFSSTVASLLPVITQAAGHLHDELKSEIPDTTNVQDDFHTGIIELTAGACASRLLMSGPVENREPIIVIISE